MNVVIIKGPCSDEIEKKVYRYLYKILSEKAKQMEINSDKG